MNAGSDGAGADFAGRYSAIDRLLHRAAFAGLGVQRGVADLEDKLYAADFAGVALDRPVFVTALPRAGTTLLLELLTATGEFTTHTYRRMPFVLCPLLWWRLSRGFAKAEAPSERAHGDGMAVSPDSVEAFEEVVWRAFWPDHYGAERIRPWDPAEVDPDGEFEAFFANHLRKIVALGDRAADAPAGRRYVSKNNANIARLGLLARLFPDARILVPVRAPGAHVASLRRQHTNFLALHGREPFARRYMEWIGHLEFGEALRPIDFGGWLDAAPATARDPSGPDFWLSYWCAAYEAALAAPADAVSFVSYDRLRAAPKEGLATLAEVVGLARPAALTALSDRFRAPTAGDGEATATDGDPALLRQAADLHARLLDRAVI
ncbi:MAG: sulfotransferase [Azospirillaceae bacterium]